MPMRGDDLRTALLGVDRVSAERMLTAAAAESSIDEVITTLVVPVLEQIGDEWVAGKVSLANVYMGSRICEEVMTSLFRSRAGAASRPHPRIAIAALLDYHLLGKKLVQLVLRSSGYDVLDLGQGITVDELVDRVKEAQVEVLLISTLMLPSALKVKELRQVLDDAGLHPQIVVGGAPFRFDEQLWKEVRADAMGASASDALRILETIDEERSRATKREHELT